MTAHDPRVTLTEALAAHHYADDTAPLGQHAALCGCGEWRDHAMSVYDLRRRHDEHRADVLASVVAEHVAARLAPIRALAEGWQEVYGRHSFAATALLKALDAPQDAPRGPVGGEQGAEVLRTPQQWCDKLGARVVDPDGWRDGTRDWSEPIAREEFDRRLLRCTIDGRGYPDFLNPNGSL